MAEEQPRVNNTKLLLISVFLGLVVMVIYNIHIEQVRSAARGESVTVYRLRRDARAREEIEMSDLREATIPRRVAESLGSPVYKQDIQSALQDPLRKSIEQNEVLVWAHFMAPGGTSDVAEIEIGMRGTTIEFDPRKSPGELLRRGDHVDVLGILRPPGERVSRTFVILPAVKVIRVPGEELDGRGGSRSRYRTVQVQVSPEVSKQLKNVMTWVEGSLWIDVRPSTESLPQDAGKIHEDLDELPANVGTRRGGPSDGFE